jgi:hypothetical protein
MSEHQHTDDCAHCGGGKQAIHIVLTVADQRRIVESEAKGPCFRMWLTEDEFKKASFADWTSYPVAPGVVAIWRKRSDVDKMLESTDHDVRNLGYYILSRELPDFDTDEKRTARGW